MTRSIRGFAAPRLRSRAILPTLHLICGLPCSGKTTLARRLEATAPAVRLSPDEWIARLYGADVSRSAADAARDRVESALADLAWRLLELGTDVILENGFWRRDERESYRRRAAELGARSELHFTHASEDELERRLRLRNADLPWGCLVIEASELRRWCREFETPGPKELDPREIAESDRSAR